MKISFDEITNKYAKEIDELKSLGPLIRFSKNFTCVEDDRGNYREKKYIEFWTSIPYSYVKPIRFCTDGMYTVLYDYDEDYLDPLSYKQFNKILKKVRRYLKVTA